MTRKLNLALTGCGLAARKLHHPALQKCRDLFRLRHVCSRSDESARGFAELTGAEWTTDYHALLEREDVEAVVLVLPVELNADFAIRALEAGKHVLVEKPIAVSRAEADRMVAATEAHPELVAMVAENFAYKPALLKLARMIEEGVLGSVQNVVWTCAGDLRPDNNPYARTEWRLNHQYPGGFIMDAGVHQIHALRMLFGELADVSARTRQVNPEIGAVDSLHLHFTTDRDITGTLTMQFSARGYGEQKLLVAGTRTCATLEGSRIILHRPETEAELIDVPNDDGGYAGQYEDFHRAIVTKALPAMTFAEGRADFETMLRVLEDAGVA